MAALAHRDTILITPRSLTTDGLASIAELTPLTEAGFELVSSAPGRVPTEAELLELTASCVGWLAGVEPISGRVLRTASNLRVISRNGVGVDNIDLDAAARRGIQIARAPGANARGVAELALGLMLSALRRIPQADRVLRGGGWQRAQGRELASCTVGLVGLGRIGRTLADLLTGVGATVIAHDPMVAPDAGLGIPLVELDELLDASNVVSLHVPAQPGSAPLLGARELTRLPRHAVLINTARASLVDEVAVLDALSTGQLGCYAVDVFETEPPPPSPLHQHDGVILTPHLGGYTAESVQRATRDAVSNLLAALATDAESS
jgi:D-3-phosphoglycerate dehydrogenase